MTIITANSTDPINDRIIEYLSLGFTAKEIAGKVGFKTRGLEKRIGCLRKQYNARSVTHLVCAYKGLVTSGPIG